jgi:hypothetical protein
MSPRRVAPVPVALLFGSIVLIPGLARADDFRLESATLPAPLLEAGKVNVVIEASAIEPIGDGSRILVAHDKHPALFIVDVSSGRILGEPITSPRFPGPTMTGPKWEGMARDAEGNYYLIGAHNGKTDEERASKSVLVRFRLKDGDLPAIEDSSLIRWDIGRSLVASLNAEGLPQSEVDLRKIEGLAIRERSPAGGQARRELVIGLREPSDKVRAFVADITASPSPDAELDLKPLFAFVAEPREGVTSQLTSLEYVAALGGFLVFTASEDQANAFHGNILWFVPDGEASHARKVATVEVAMKAEGLAVLGVENHDQRTTVRLVISYDNDPHATKIPSRIQTAILTRDNR